ncbi:hypothetical protein [Halobacillus sp. K22]|uniref:hypothetical protein n=1 Tax=Halobacillus sp. K22 TaxID=3457431 RepID=UPI003FCD51C4
MEIGIDSLISFIILWGTPGVVVGVTYFRMDKSERNEAIDDFKSFHSIFTVGFLTIGAFLSSLGNLLSIDIFKYTGISLLAIAGVTSVIMMWNKSKVRSLVIIILVGVAIMSWI